MKVLYADAKKTWHTLMEKVLAPRGVELIHAETLKEVLNKVNTEKPEVAIINVALKNGKAYDVIPDILSAGIPVVFIGLKSEGFDEEKAKEMGVKFVLPKPFTVDDLFRLVNEARLEKPKMEVKAEKPEIVLTGGKKEHPEEIEITPAEEVMEIQPIEENVLHIGGEETELEPITLEPESSEETIAIQPIEGGISLEEKEEKTPVLEEETSEKEKLAQAFGVSKFEEPEKVPQEVEKETEEKTAEEVQKSVEEEPSETSPVEKVEPQQPVVPEAEVSPVEKIDIEDLKKQLKEELAEEFKKEAEEIIKSIAWEVIPDMAEKVIREEIEKFIRSRLV
ncbi:MULTISPECIES: response regulator [unclassified Desulfurobacterium]|uniref:response regulator n=1 Tax=Desulfurobacterium sp. TC5-1 TaxID=1158318 RepID=UPI0003B43FA1|nr:response regulator [Desulfurobacterium sp. TC5-1]